MEEAIEEAEFAIEKCRYDVAEVYNGRKITIGDRLYSIMGLMIQGKCI
ncbi:MAG: hypothetical protein PHQ46_02175 [Negativicutes bacterium]|nr:hypothetical protein [Negativicutes bacterium]